MSLKIFIDYEKKIKEEILIKVGRGVTIHFKCRAAETLKSQILEFGRLNLKWQKIHICKLYFMSKEKFINLISPFRAAVDLAAVALEIKSKLALYSENTNFFNLFNNLASFTLNSEEVILIKKIIFK